MIHIALPDDRVLSLRSTRKDQQKGQHDFGSVADLVIAIEEGHAVRCSQSEGVGVVSGLFLLRRPVHFRPKMHKRVMA